MSKDLEILKQVERQIGMELKRLDHNTIGGFINGYAIDENESVIGLNLYALEKPDISFVEDFKNLTLLILRDNPISDFSVIKDLKNLRTLDLSYNQITNISFLENLKNLTLLDLNSNEISDISFLVSLESLDLVYLKDNQITDIFALRDLGNLTHLYLSYNQISDITSLKDLENLTHLSLSSNPISDYSSLRNLKNLTLLSLRDNRISDISFLKGLNNLNHLILESNQIVDISFLEDLKNLILVVLSNNQISNISSLKGLRKLTLLSLRNNYISDISFLKDLENLSWIDLSSNLIKVLPKKITFLEQLKYISLEENPIKTPPPEIADAGIEAIRNYFIDLEDQGEDYVYEAKLIVVGLPGAGKTSLTAKLLDPGYELNPTEPMTKGIDVKNWHFPYSKKKEFRANIWDFGGQEIMHATHRYFLTKRSLYLVMADNRKEDTDFYYWLNLVELLSGRSSVIIVLNEKFKYRKYIPENVLRSFNSVQKIFNVNLADNTGLADLSNAIQQIMKSLPHVGKEPVPRKWVEIRKILEAENRNYISRRMYMDICKQHGISDEKKALYISEFLHDLGVILHFQRDRVLRNTIILNTRWATEAVYLVLFHDTVIDSGGEFDNNDLDRIWSSPDFRDKHADLLQLMIKFELCYEIGQSQRYIIPELLPEKPPSVSYAQDIKKNDLLHFEYRYNFLPKGIISRLIVRLNKHIFKKNQWKYGAVLQIEDTIAEIIEYFHQKVLKIRISGKNKVEALAIIRNEIKEVHDTFESLEPDEMIPCRCNQCRNSESPFFFRYDLLKRCKQKGKNKVMCEKSLADVRVSNLLSDTLASKPEKPVHSEFLKYSENENQPQERNKIFLSYSHSDGNWLKRVLTHLRALKHEGFEMDMWDDTQIKAGRKWEREIENAISEAKIAVLLISADFLASDFITQNELPPLLEAAEKDGAIIIPLILKPSRFTKNKNLSQFQAVNEPNNSLINLSEGEQEEILVKLTETIEEHLK